MKKLVYLYVILITCSTNLLWSQCAMCRAVLESNQQTATAEGINNGITYLMAIPYILVGVIGYQIVKKPKKR